MSKTIYPARILRHKVSNDLELRVQIPGRTLYVPILGASWKELLEQYDLEAESETEVYQEIKLTLKSEKSEKEQQP